MSLQIELKSSAVSGKLPQPSDLALGEIALNFNADGPFLSCKDTAGNIRRLNNVRVSATAFTPATVGELWLDSSSSPAVLKIYQSAQTTWVPAVTIPTATVTAFGTVRLASAADVTNGTAGKIIDAAQLAGAIAGFIRTVTGVAPLSVTGSPADKTITITPGSARQLLQTNSGGTGVEFASNIDVPGTLDVTGAATFDAAVTIQGDLTVNGTETIINTQTLDVEDKNIELGVVATPTDTTADGGGITLKGATDKTINWVDATDAWTLSEHVDLASTKEYRIAGAKVLDATSLGSAVVTSSLTSVGTIGTGTWQGTDIADTYLATITTAGKVSNSATTAASANTAGAIVARDGSGNFTAGTITAALTGNASTATALETARTIGGVSFDGTANINLPGVNTAGNQDTTGNAATVTTNADLTGDVTSVGNATSIAAGVIVDADINASAAIALSKLATGALPTAITVASANIVDGTIVDADVNASADIAGTKIVQGSTTVRGTVQLEDSTTSTSTTTAATPASVKAAYDLANAALPKAGGTMTGDITFSGTQTFPGAGSGTVTSVDVSGGTGLTSSGGPVTTSGTITIDLDNTAVTPASYTYASVTVDQQGRITAASSGTAPLTSSDIGVTVQGFDADTAKLDVAQTFTAVQTLTDPAIIGTILEDVFTITDSAAFEVDPGNGSIQLITLGANRTPLATNFAAGESITLMVDDGTAYTLTWTDSTWGSGGVTWVGGSAPTLATSGYTVIQFWKVSTTVYGAYVGDVA